MLSCWEERDFGGVLGFAPAVAVAGSWVRINRPSWSIRADRVEELYLVQGRNKGKGAKVSCMRGQAGGRGEKG